MNFKEEVIYNIQDCIFKDSVRCARDSSLRLSHIKDEYFCLITKNNSFRFFSKVTPAKLNIFYSKIYDMLFSKNYNGMGCFDYERQPIQILTDVENNNIIDKVNSYFGSATNFILIKVDLNTLNDIIPVAFVTYKNDFIWNVCTGIDFRNKGYMTMLLKHFFDLYKIKELNYLKLDLKENGLSLVLLKSNPDFDSVRNFYSENGFTVKSQQPDRIIMQLEVS